jgi:phage replication-related protein YjqB (UPF0714/DUF867 family)
MLGRVLAVLCLSFLLGGCMFGDQPIIGRIAQAVGTDIDVLKAKSSQSYLIGYGERISMDPDLASAEGVVEGQQVRITRQSATTKYGIYTVYEFYEDGSDNDDVRMALAGRQRLDTSDSFAGYLDGQTSVVVHGETDAWLQSNNEFGEFLDETSSSQTDVLILAPHGGYIESYTDEEASRVQTNLDNESKDASAWYCIGYQSAIGAFDAWHITSTEISEESFPYLDDVSARTFDYAVSFHGYSGSDVLVGGGASSALKTEIKEAIEAIDGFSYDVSVVTSGEYAGTDPDNIVNRYSDEGVQIEQPYGARSGYWQDIADAVSDVLSSKF